MPKTKCNVVPTQCETLARDCLFHYGSMTSPLSFRVPCKQPNKYAVTKTTDSSASGTTSNGTTTTKGFKTGWSREQLEQIASLQCNAAQQQQQQETPPENPSDANEIPVGGKETPAEEATEGKTRGGIEASPKRDGSRFAPDFLSDDDTTTLGAPSGDDIDPAMTAIFKVRPILRTLKAMLLLAVK